MDKLSRDHYHLKKLKWCYRRGLFAQPFSRAPKNYDPAPASPHPEGLHFADLQIGSFCWQMPKEDAENYAHSIKRMDDLYLDLR